LAIVEKIEEAARQEFEDEDFIRNKLLELQLSYELGDIGQAEYEENYRQLVIRLQALQQESKDHE